MNEIVDWSRIKYRIDNLPSDKLVVDQFRDLNAHREQFMSDIYEGRPEGIPEDYDVNDWILRYLILLDSPGTPADDILDLVERKAWVLRKLGVSKPTDTILGMASFTDKRFMARRVLFLRLQNDVTWMVLKATEAKLSEHLAKETPTDEREALVHSQNTKLMMQTINDCKAEFLKHDSNKAMEEGLMALVVNDNLGIRPEEYARVLAKGNEIFPHISIFSDGRIDE
jgi:hypothetical protein